MCGYHCLVLQINYRFISCWIIIFFFNNKIFIHFPQVTDLFHGHLRFLVCFPDGLSSVYGHHSMLIAQSAFPWAHIWWSRNPSEFETEQTKKFMWRG
ncbi:hypothetical protein M8C21_020025 [Ambrosia artemisiifolia]|uniref:Uncharacterized protein n=1 Tax=Ambrosia artemisiifolia TaxID=4212 RepID=A0AAD5GVL4_AMBAR|nr:hypothetical protein M8C21_020025 [Ambrosia artemisiifolia]